MSRPATLPRTALGRAAEPEAPPSGPRFRGHAARVMLLLVVLVLLLMVEVYLTRAGYLMPVPPMI